MRKVVRAKDERNQLITSQPSRPGKLDPFRLVIQRLVLADQLTAVLALEEIRTLGYSGGHFIP